MLEKNETSKLNGTSSNPFQIENGVLEKYTGSDVNVIVPEGVRIIGEDAFSMREDITSVILQSGVTTIENGAFYGCESLKYVVIPDTVMVIDNNAFEACSALESIVIPESVIKIGSQAFSFCNAMKLIMVSTNNTNYKSIDGNLYTKDGKTLIRYAVGKSDDCFCVPDCVNYIETNAFCSAYELKTLIIESEEIEIEEDSLGNIDGGSGIERIVICNGVKSVNICRDAITDSDDIPSIYVENGVDIDDFDDDWNGGLPVYDSRTNKLLIAADVD